MPRPQLFSDIGFYMTTAVPIVYVFALLAHYGSTTCTVNFRMNPRDYVFFFFLGGGINVKTIHPGDLTPLALDHFPERNKLRIFLYCHVATS